MSARRKARSPKVEVQKRDTSQLWKLLPAWLLPSISPIYELWLVKEEFPILLELAILAAVFIYCVWAFGIKRRVLACFLALFAIFGTIALIHLLLGLHSGSNGQATFGLMVFVFCTGTSWALTRLATEPVSAVDLPPLNWIEKTMAWSTAIYGLWLLASWFHNLLTNRVFMLNNETQNFGAWFALLVFVLSLGGCFYSYSREQNATRWRKFFMPLAISFFLGVVGLVTFHFGMLFSIHALVAGQTKQVTYVVKDLQRDPTRRSMCPYSVTYQSLGGNSSQSKCVSGDRYRVLKIGDQLHVTVLVTPFGELVRGELRQVQVPSK